MTNPKSKSQDVDYTRVVTFKMPTERPNSPSKANMRVDALRNALVKLRSFIECGPIDAPKLHQIEHELRKWCEVHKGGAVDDALLEDNFDLFTDEKLVRALFAIQKMAIGDTKTARAQRLARRIWNRLIRLIVRAETVTRAITVESPMTIRAN